MRVRLAKRVLSWKLENQILILSPFLMRCVALGKPFDYSLLNVNNNIHFTELWRELKHRKAPANISGV